MKTVYTMDESHPCLTNGLTERLYAHFREVYARWVLIRAECGRDGDASGVKLCDERLNRLSEVNVRLRHRLESGE